MSKQRVRTDIIRSYEKTLASSGVSSEELWRFNSTGTHSKRGTFESAFRRSLRASGGVIAISADLIQEPVQGEVLDNEVVTNHEV